MYVLLIGVAKIYIYIYIHWACYSNWRQTFSCSHKCNPVCPWPKNDHRVIKTIKVKMEVNLNVICQKRWTIQDGYWITLTIYPLTSIIIFSVLFSVHFLRCWQGEFVQQWRVSFGLPYSVKWSFVMNLLEFDFKKSAKIKNAQNLKINFNGNYLQVPKERINIVLLLTEFHGVEGGQ